MADGEKRKVVYFNLAKEEQRAMYELASEMDFSAEVKRWLGERLQRRRALVRTSEITVDLGGER